MKPSGCSLPTFVLAFCLGPHALADIAPQNLRELQQYEAIVIGTVRQIRVEAEPAEYEERFGNQDWGIYVTLQLERVEKGRVAASELEFRCFRIKSRRSVLESMTISGHRPIPEIGSRVRVYLKSDGRGWAPALPNGITPPDANDDQSVRAAGRLAEAPEVSRLRELAYTFLLPLELWGVVVVIVGAVAVLATVFARRQRGVNAGNRTANTTLLLLVAASALATAMGLLGLASWLESASFVTGALCVWLTVKQNIWNFPLGLVNVSTFCVVFFQAGLYADAGLQIVYFGLGAIGWHLWLHGGANRSPLKVTRASAGELSWMCVFVAASTLGLWKALAAVGGSASFWDALTTSLSLASQWLLNRKRLESWIGWILVDLIYVPLYISKDLYLTAMLYGLFLLMAVMGLRAWQAAWRQDSNVDAAEVLIAGAGS
jgi:nicotinamide mononucleotide transporter